MESFSLLPVRTSSGKVIKQKRYEDLLEQGVRIEDALNIILGKKGKRWSDRMTYMSPTIFRGPSMRDEGIMNQLKAPGIRHPKIKSRVIHLTGVNIKSKDMIRTKKVIKPRSALELLNNQEMEFLDEDMEHIFDLDYIVEGLENIDFVPEKK
uniref:Uncharacterized protein n=1 Tax=Pithovirus LCPAC001 TaxID=2506585 RepID=A0A481Z2B0_9VIRU|nr:MAG: hypothetical protein LCPAC001_00840 [Pithovirus LCPAC001]